MKTMGGIWDSVLTATIPQMSYETVLYGQVSPSPSI